MVYLMINDSKMDCDISKGFKLSYRQVDFGILGGTHSWDSCGTHFCAKYTIIIYVFRVLPGSLICTYIHSGGITIPLNKPIGNMWGNLWKPVRGFTVENRGLRNTIWEGKTNKKPTIWETNITIKNCHVQWIYPFKMVMFQSVLMFCMFITGYQLGMVYSIPLG